MLGLDEGPADVAGLAAAATVHVKFASVKTTAKTHIGRIEIAKAKVRFLFRLAIYLRLFMRMCFWVLGICQPHFT